MGRSDSPDPLQLLWAATGCVVSTAGRPLCWRKIHRLRRSFARVVALDIGKAEVVCCVRVPHEGKPGRRLQEVATYSPMTRSLLGMADHLRCLGVTRVVLEATSDYVRREGA
jgi:hypothetical protein